MDLLLPEFWLTGLGSWAASYLFHSTIILAFVLCLTEFGAWVSESRKDVLLKMALVAGVFTASVQFVQSSYQPFSGTVVFDLSDGSGDSQLQNQDYQRSITNNNLHYIARGGIAQTSSDQNVHLSVNWLHVLITVWLVGIVLFALRFALRWYWFKRDIGERVALTHQPTIDLCKDLQSRMGLTRNIELTQSNQISSPMAIGLSQICLPEGMWDEVDKEQMTAIIAHELAHVRRLDPIWLFFWHVMSVIFFFQPLNRMTQLSFQTRAEFLADATALRQTKDPVAMVNSLVKAAQLAKRSNLGSLTSNLLGHNATIVSRSKMLLSEKLIKPRTSLTFVLLSALVLVSLSVTMLPTISLSSKQSNTNSDWQQFTEQDSYVWTQFANTRLRYETNLDYVESIAGRQIELFTRRVTFSQDLDGIADFGPFARLRFVNKSIYSTTSFEVSVDWRNRVFYRYEVDGESIDDQAAALDFMRQMLDGAIGKDDEFKRRALAMYAEQANDADVRRVNRQSMVESVVERALLDSDNIYSKQDRAVLMRMYSSLNLFDGMREITLSKSPLLFFNAMAISDDVTASFSEFGLLYISPTALNSEHVSIQYDLRDRDLLDLYLNATGEQYQRGLSEKGLVEFLVKLHFNLPNEQIRWLREQTQ